MGLGYWRVLIISVVLALIITFITGQLWLFAEEVPRGCGVDCGVAFGYPIQWKISVFGGGVFRSGPFIEDFVFWFIIIAFILLIVWKAISRKRGKR
jgi:hypothetical protein